MMKKITLSIISVIFSFNSAFSQSANNNSQNQLANKKPKPPHTKQYHGFQYSLEGGVITQDQATKMLDLRLRNFAECLELLIRKKPGWDYVIDNYAMRLFGNDEEVRVQVQNKGEKSPRTYKIREYLDRVSRLSYDHIQVTYCDFNFKSQLHKGKNNVYHGTASVIQKFYGYNQNRELPAYQDQLAKEINFTIEVVEEQSATGPQSKRFNLYLADITVKEFK
jgi:ribosomal protein S24E